MLHKELNKINKSRDIINIKKQITSLKFLKDIIFRKITQKGEKKCIRVTSYLIPESKIRNMMMIFDNYAKRKNSP